MRLLPVLGIVATVTVLTLQAGWTGALCGLALVGLTGLAVQSPNGGLLGDETPNSVQREVAAILDKVPGITAAHPRDFHRAISIMTLRDGTTVSTWKNPVGFDHVFLSDSDSQMLYGAYVGWIHSQGLQKAIAKIRGEFS